MAFSSRTMTAEDWTRIRHFRREEFREPEKMGYEFMLWLDELREKAGVPIPISSSYRSPAYNRQVDGAPRSAHTDTPCNAVDVPESPRSDDPNWNASRWAIVTAAIGLGCRRIGFYANGSLHIDRSEDSRPAPRLWRVVGSITKN